MIAIDCSSHQSNLKFSCRWSLVCIITSHKAVPFYYFCMSQKTSVWSQKKQKLLSQPQAPFLHVHIDTDSQTRLAIDTNVSQTNVTPNRLESTLNVSCKRWSSAPGPCNWIGHLPCNSLIVSPVNLLTGKHSVSTPHGCVSEHVHATIQVAYRLFRWAAQRHCHSALQALTVVIIFLTFGTDGAVDYHQYCYHCGHYRQRFLSLMFCRELGLPLGLEAPVMTLNGVIFLFFSFVGSFQPFLGRVGAHGLQLVCQRPASPQAPAKGPQLGALLRRRAQVSSPS